MNEDYKVIKITSKGGPEVLKVLTEKLKPLAKSKVRIKVKYVGLAFGDKMRRMGVLSPPWAIIPGYDITGEIIEVGKGVDQSLLGQQVAALMLPIGNGGYSEIVDVKPKHTLPIDSDMDHQVVLALGLNYITASHILKLYSKLAADANVFIHGISGNVGLALADFSSVIPHNLYGTCSAKNTALVEGAGGIAFDYRQQDWQSEAQAACPQGYDMVIDGLGFYNLPLSKDLLKSQGKLIFLGLTSDAEKGMLHCLKGSLIYLSMLLKGTKLRPYVFGTMPKAWPVDCIQTWQENIELYRQGKLKPMLGSDYAFSEVSKAHEEMDTGSTHGKMTLRID